MIIPIRDLKDTTNISKLCHEKDEPIFITKNGYDDMVIMSSECYEKISHKEVHYTVNEPQSKLMVAEDLNEYTYGPKYTIPQIKKILDPICKKNNIKSAILFGSYATGTARNNSDIDLVVDCELHGLSFFGLLGEVCDAFSVPIDLIAKYQITEGSPIDMEIGETGIRIYG